MDKLFENLLISSPNNGGGVFLSCDGDIYRLDEMSTTGLFCCPDIVVRGMQSKYLCIYDRSVHLISGDTIGFDDIHDVLYVDGHYYIVSTFNNTIIKLSKDFEEIQRWVFPGENDSWHINCLGYWQGRIVFSAFGEFNEYRGYKGKTAGVGFVQDLYTGERIITGLSQPHNLVSVESRLFLTNSENRELLEFSSDGKILRSKQLDGYTRGLLVSDNVIYVGLSKSRNIDFDEVLSATVVALDLATLNEVGRLLLPAEEIYDIQQLINKEQIIKFLASNPAISLEITRKMLTSRDKIIIKRDEKITDFKIYYSVEHALFNEDNTLSYRYSYSSTGQMTKFTLAFPNNVQCLTNLRLDPASEPLAIVLHRLAFLDGAGNELWRWDGGEASFTNMLGAALRNTSEGPCLLCYNDDPQFELVIPADVMQWLGSGCSLVVEMTPRPLLDVLPEVLDQAYLQAPVVPSVYTALPTLQSATHEFIEIAQLMKTVIERRNETIANQRAELEALRARQKVLETHVQRAEAQLDVLKEFVLAAFGKSTERI